MTDKSAKELTQAIERLTAELKHGFEQVSAKLDRVNENLEIMREPTLDELAGIKKP